MVSTLEAEGMRSILLCIGELTAEFIPEHGSEVIFELS